MFSLKQLRVEAIRMLYLAVVTTVAILVLLTTALSLYHALYIVI